MAMATQWTTEKTEQLRQLWADGFSCSQIGARIGKSRNAVIGRVHRLHLPERTTTVRTQYSRRRTQPKPQPNAKGKGKPFVFLERRISPGQALHLDGLPIPSPAEFDVPRIKTVDLEPHHCRFPCVADVKTVGPYDPIFCGLKPVAGLPYCPVHAKRAFAPPQTRPRPTFPAIAPVENEMEAA
jgi:GcrA cell cycle regulator